MSARITSVAFNEWHFQMSPHVSEFAFKELTGKFLIIAMCRKEDFTNFTDVFPEDEQGEVLGVPDGSYAVMVRLEGSVTNPKIIFDFLNTSTLTIAAQAEMDYRDFYTKFEEASAGHEMQESRSGEFINFADPEAFEVTWSIEYLKNLLSDKVQGNDAFWKRLNGDLDMVLLPVNIRMNMAIDLPDAPQKVEVIFGYDPAFGKKPPD